MIARDEIDRVKDNSDIVDLISRHGISLKASGISFKGNCPFHDEKSPSFYVHPTSNTYHCFGCGEGGDIFSFLQKKEGMTFTEAIHSVADMFNIVVVETQTDSGEISKKKRLLSVMKASADFFRQGFREQPLSHPAKEELVKRDLLEVSHREGWLEEFGLGYAPAGMNNLHKHLNKLGFSIEEQLEVGLIRTSDNGGVYDVFKGRLTWEIRDVQGRPVGFGARKLMETDTLGKYLNSSNTPLYNKSNALYGLDLARVKAVKEKRIYVVEGYTDVMALAAAGITNVIATCGTAFGAGHAQIVRRLLGDDGMLVFVFDPDVAGRKAARRTFEVEGLKHSQVYVAVPKTPLDPCDLRLEKGDEAIIEMCNSLISITEFVLTDELSKHDIKEPEQRTAFLRESCRVLNEISDPSLQDSYVRKVAFWSGSTLDVVQKMMKSLKKNSNEPDWSYEDTEQTAVSVDSKQQEALLALMVQYPLESFFALKDKDISTDYFSVELQPIFLEIWELLKATTGHVEHIYPDNFSSPEKILQLLHKGFAVLNVVEESKKASMVARMAESSWRAISDLHRRAQNATLQTRFTQAFADSGQLVDDLSVLEEVLEQQRRR